MQGPKRRFWRFFNAIYGIAIYGIAIYGIARDGRKEGRTMAIKIGVDAGHGSQTAGKRTPPMPVKTGSAAKGGQIWEHWANTWVVYYTAYYLAKYGFEVVRTGWGPCHVQRRGDGGGGKAHGEQGFPEKVRSPDGVWNF